MPHRSRTIAAAVLVAACATLAAGCTSSSPSATAEQAAVHAHEAQPADARAAGAEVNAALAALRRETAPYHNIAKAKDANWATPITPCWYSSTAGGAMGYHYGDPSRIDGVVDSLRPEALMYEPLPGGAHSLVGVEYIVPIAAWTGAGRPELFGREFDRNDGLGLYVLHVWAWRDNPNGMFAGWNPKVSCAAAEASEDRG